MPPSADSASFAAARPNAYARLATVLAMADIAPIAEGRVVAVAPLLGPTFVVSGKSHARIGAGALEVERAARVAVRHALELCAMLELCPDDPVLAGLMAARSAALFAELEQGAGPEGDPPWRALLSAPAAPSLIGLSGAWASLREHQSEAPDSVTAQTARRLADAWGLLGPAEYLMGVGGDVRISLDAETGLNAYGCSPRPRPWAVTFASSTASSISERGYAGAELARRRMLATALRSGGGEGRRAVTEGIRRALAAFYALPAGTEIVLSPSGTDGELCALAVALLAEPARPVDNVLVAPEESGTGVPLAATGVHFASATARGVAVVKGERIAGFPDDTRLVTVAARAADGATREAAAVDAECAAKVAASIAEGRRVLLHVMDQTKTGLLVPADAARIARGHEADVDVVVDACQARVSVPTVKGYLARGFMVLVTGSKFFTGPPFAGALFLPPAIASRLAGPRRLPAGLADYSGRFDWPDAAPASAAFSGDANVGLAMRWEAALEEMRAFAAVGDEAILHILSRFGSAVCAAIEASPDLALHRAPPLARAGASAGWDALPTIFPFSVRAPAARAPAATGEEPRRLLDLDEARRIYAWLNSDLSPCLPERCTPAERALASRHVHLGQPVALATASGSAAGALRICAGARLVSGEPSQAGLDPAARLEREIDDALAGLAKISLILRYESEIRAAAPRPTFR